MDQFVELLRAAQGGHGMENLARVYGLSTQQAQAVAEALMPAFADGFRHITQSPEAMASLMALMVNGPYGAYYGQPASYTAPYAPPPAAAPPPPQPNLNQVGVDALNAVFGSNEVSRAVANHAAATTGLGVAVVQQMLPTFASLFVGGLAKSLAASGALQTMTAAMLSRLPIGQPATRPAPISSGNPWIDAFLAFSTTTAANAPSYASGNPWADAFARVMFQQAPAPAAPQARANPAHAWQDVVNAMTSTLAQAGAPPASTYAPPPPPQPAPQPAPDAAANPLQPFQDFFAKMFAQGFPPTFPAATGTERPPYAFPEFWLDMLARGRPATPEAEILPPEKPRLVRKDSDSK
ncbi:DUF937 domain-containing protein [Xanthobacter sp. V4C-4]|uniref:DUF937 domain-containing protein n=1 Tax=Xanthobacter cornucopiae TaxID=3119924 RepID=UPI00372A389A